MKSSNYIAAAFIFMTIIYGCTDENNNEIEEALQVHFDSFVAEASNHGVTIDLSDLDIGGYVEGIEARGTLGQCKSYSDGSNKVVIDQEYWNQASDLDREYIVFHELGHCILKRDHEDTSDDHGNCLSIMQSGDNQCQGEYMASNRAELLTELFTY